MRPRLLALLSPAIAAASLLGATSPALAASHPGVPHHHDTLPLPVTGAAPGLQQTSLSLPAASYNVSNQNQLTAALQSARPGQVIHLASGSSFSQIFDTTARAGWVTVSGAGDAVAPVIDGANLEGSQYLRFTNVEFTGRVYIARNPGRGTAQPANNVQVLNSDINCGSTSTSPGTVGIVVRQASQNVTITGDYIHNCTIGFSTVAQDNPSSNVTIAHNEMQYFYGDAMDIGGLSNSIIADNIIQDIHHSPGVVYHDDGIQFMGNTQNILIQNNVLDNSGDQLIFVQDAIKGTFDNVQTNSNLLIDHNLVYGAGAAAVQLQGAVNTRFVDNTVWDAHAVGLIVRKSPYTGTTPATTTVQGNILQSYIQMGGAPQVENDNLIAWAVPHVTYGPNDITGVMPSFVNASAGDFALQAGTPGSGSAASSTATSTTGAPVNLTTASAATAQMPLGANPQNVAYGAPQFGTN